MEKTVDYYMGLPYAVELDFDGDRYRASIRELPECTARGDTVASGARA